MKFRRATLAAAAAILLTSAALFAQQARPWIHVEVTESGAKESKVRVNVPLALAEAALALSPVQKAIEENLDLDDMQLSVEDIRQLWQELKAAGDAELVTVADEDETVRVFREGDVFRVEVRQGEDGETVNVQAPVAVIDALLSGEGQELNIRGAVAQLSTSRGEIVRVESERELVRIWIDERS